MTRQSAVGTDERPGQTSQNHNANQRKRFLQNTYESVTQIVTQTPQGFPSCAGQRAKTRDLQ